MTIYKELLNHSSKRRCLLCKGKLKRNEEIIVFTNDTLYRRGRLVLKLYGHPDCVKKRMELIFNE